MRGLVVFVVAFVGAAAMGALLARPAPGEPAVAAESPFAFFPSPVGEAEARTVPLRGEGTVPSGARLCRAEGQCTVASTGGVPLPLAEARGLSHVDLVVEWSPSSLSTQRLSASLRTCAEDGCGEPLARATGGSPLRLAVAGEDVGAGLVMLVVEPEDLSPASPIVSATTADQAFVVVGEAAFR